MFDQNQINTVSSSYSQEVVKLLEVKASLHLTILDLRRQLTEKSKKIEELEKKLKSEEKHETA